jgi:DNA-binding HxlR family transcriptional regulator
MTEPQWKLVVDQQGVTITSEKFQFTTNGTRPAGAAEIDLEQQAAMNSAESAHMESVVSQLQTMTRRTYGQYCGLGRALELVGERWTMLFIRDLLVRNKSLEELQQGFPAVAPEIVTSRIRELEHGAVVKQVEEEDGVTRYRLTSFGRELEEVAIPLGRWGARLLGPPRPEDTATIDSVRMAFRTMFRPEVAGDRKVSFQLNLGDIVMHVKVADGKAETGVGALDGVDLVIDEPGPALMPLLTGELTVTEAVETGAVKIIGDPALLPVFTELFQVFPMPVDTE